MNTNDLLQLIANLIESLCEDRDVCLDEPVGPETLLIGDLDLASVDLVEIFVEIEEACGRKIGFHDLVMPDGEYVEDLTVAQIARFIEAELKRDSTDAAAPASEAGHRSQGMGSKSVVIDAGILAAFEGIIPPAEIRGTEMPAKPNQKAIFLFSSPRSGSTLLRVILGGHPGLFSPPELHLLNYPDMAHRRMALDNDENRHLLSGVVTAVSQARGCSLQAAQSLLSDFERDTMPTLEFYGLLQGWIGDRLLVDKSPIYGFQEEVLLRAEAGFESPLFVHLVRHPGGVIRSFMDAKMENLVPALRNSSFSSREIAELVWIVTQQNIMKMQAKVPSERFMRVRFEDLIQSPEATVRSLCDFLGITFASRMLDPYSDTEQRMTKGVDDVSRFSGDLKFHLHRDIEPRMASRWRNYLDEDSMSDVTIELAASLGYAPDSLQEQTGRES